MLTIQKEECKCFEILKRQSIRWMPGYFEKRTLITGSFSFEKNDGGSKVYDIVYFFFQQ
jgi:hypothetical protein